MNWHDFIALKEPAGETDTRLLAEYYARIAALEGALREIVLLPRSDRHLAWGIAVKALRQS